MQKTITTIGKITDIAMERTEKGWIAHCTVKTTNPTLVLGTFKTEEVIETNDLPAALEAGLKKFAEELQDKLIPLQH